MKRRKERWKDGMNVTHSGRPRRLRRVELRKERPDKGAQARKKDIWKEGKAGRAEGRRKGR
jgi:hypothetical protein